MKDVTVGSAVAVDIIDKGVVAWVSAEYAPILEADLTWYVNEDLNQFQGVDLIETRAVVMGLQRRRKDVLDPGEQLLINLAAKIKETTDDRSEDEEQD